MLRFLRNLSNMRRNDEAEKRETDVDRETERVFAANGGTRVVRSRSQVRHRRRRLGAREVQQCVRAGRHRASGLERHSRPPRERRPVQIWLHSSRDPESRRSSHGRSICNVTWKYLQNIDVWRMYTGRIYW